ncbi:MAG: helix-turn-helix domain-containing protein, partial [Shewanella sp.]|uniref:helix-turn-helix domain-containing protein n=1 Tax=Shewanella sp. TaxID=50422 RepID=UPI003F3EAB53
MYALKKEKISVAKIAQNIGTCRSTVYRELARNTGKKGYRPKQAHALAESRKHSA